MRTQQCERRATRRRVACWGAVVTGLVLAGSVVPAAAALTTPACLGLKLKAWGSLRKCQRTEDAKAFEGRLADPVKCQTKFQDALASIRGKATAAAIACRYRDNGDSTVTDLDTGLMWERKNAITVTQTIDWTVGMTLFLEGCNGTSADRGQSLAPGCSIFHDWRIPNILELQTIIDTSRPGCGTGAAACIDPIFEPTAPFDYWSATLVPPGGGTALFVNFQAGVVGFTSATQARFIRAVRSAF
jgi:Protein of unknown function (DUF1566)